MAGRLDRRAAPARRMLSPPGFIERYFERSMPLRSAVFPQEQREVTGWLRLAVAAACIALTLITLYFAFTVTIGQIETRSLHLVFALPLTLLLYPATRWSPRARPSVLDVLLALGAVAAFTWSFRRADDWLDRFVGYDPIPTADVIFGVIALVTIFEATRRIVGPTIVVLNLFFITYALTGAQWPGIMRHGGMSIPAFIETMYMDAEGIFNFITGLMATFIFTFLLFGVVLRISGGDRIFNDFAAAIAGHRRGGPAKVAVVSSAMMGMLSGSSISNVSTTGAMTIPMMKRMGFKSHQAAAVEVVSSVGGGLMPPLMGTGIFIMATLANVPLLDILLYSLAPAMLYFAAIYVYTDIKAAKHGFVGMPREQLPRLGDVILQGGHIFIPIAALVALLALQYTPYFASAACVVLTMAVSCLRVSTRMTLTKLIVALEAGARVALTIAALIVSAAVIYAVMVHTGLLNKVTSIVISYSGGYSAVAIVLIGLLSYIVGMGLPVTASYVIIAALGAGALQEMGIGVLAAHLIIFWFAQDSTITPPICMTAFVGARIAEAPPMRTGWECMKIAKALYIIPFMFAYSSLLDPSIIEIAYDFVLALVMFALLAAAIDGYWRWPLGPVSRCGLIASSALLFAATIDGWRASGYWAAAAIVCLGLTLLVSLRDRRARLQPA